MESSVLLRTPQRVRLPMRFNYNRVNRITTAAAGRARVRARVRACLHVRGAARGHERFAIFTIILDEQR